MYLKYYTLCFDYFISFMVVILLSYFAVPVFILTALLGFCALTSSGRRWQKSQPMEDGTLQNRGEAPPFNSALSTFT